MAAENYQTRPLSRVGVVEEEEGAASAEQAPEVPMTQADPGEGDAGSNGQTVEVMVSASDEDWRRTVKHEQGRGKKRQRGFRRQPADALKTGDTLARYIIIERVAEGGMGVVYAAYDPQLDRRVALKLLRSDRTSARSASMRLQREAQGIARLSHPNIVTVYDVGYHGESVFVAMEYVQGTTLREWLRAKPRSWREVVAMYIQAGQGLAAAHEAGLVHRDFKPDNVLVGTDGRVRVVDFGLVAASGGTSTPLPSDSTSGDSEDTGSRSTDSSELAERMTVSHAIMGTPAYMAPEQHSGRTTDVRADQYGFCASLYEGLYDRLPFTAKLLEGLLAEKEGNFVEAPPEGSDVPAWLKKAVLRGLRASPDERWPSMNALLAELRKDPEARRGRYLVRGALGVAIAALSATFGMQWQHASSSSAQAVCARATERLGGVWDTRIRAEAERAVLATGVPYAADTWASVVQTLDAYAEMWLAMHRNACEATHVRREQSATLLDTRMVCLQRRLDELGAFARVLTQADTTAVQNAVHGARNLSGVAHCGDLEALTAEVAPPADASTQSEVARLSKRLAEVQAEADAGHYQSAMNLAVALVKEADALGYMPLRAEARAILGRLQILQDSYAEAEKSLLDAFLQAQRSKHDRIAAAAAILLIDVKSAAEPKAADAWVPYAEAAVARLGRSAKDEGALALSLGRMRHHQGRFAEALSSYRAALSNLTDVYGADHPMVARVYTSLGHVYQTHGHIEESRNYHQIAREVLEKNLGSAHPEVATAVKNIANTYIAEGDYANALTYNEQALRIWRAVHGNEHSRVAAATEGIASAYYGMGEYEKALSYYREGLAIWRAVMGEEHPELAVSYSYLGDTLHAQGDYKQAILHHERALALTVKAYGPEHLQASFSRHNLGMAYAALGQHAKAREHQELALTHMEKSLGASSPNLAYPLTGLGIAYLGLGDAARARALLERAYSLREGAKGTPIERAETTFALARALWPLGERERAITLARSALALFEEAGVPGLKRRTEASMWLADKGQSAP